MLTTVVDEKADILTRLACFSKWHRMKRCIAWILRLKQLLTHKQLPLTDKAHRRRNAAIKDTSHESFTVEEMQRAEKTILRLVQDSAFPRELEVLRKIQREHCEESRDFLACCVLGEDLANHECFQMISNTRLSSQRRVSW